MKTSCSFTKNNLKSFFRPGWKGMGDPGVEEVETRIFVKPGRGCGAVSHLLMNEPIVRKH